MSLVLTDTESHPGQRDREATDNLLAALVKHHGGVEPVRAVDHSKEIEALKLRIQSLMDQNDELQATIIRQKRLIDILAEDACIPKPRLAEIIRAVSTFYRMPKAVLVGQSRTNKVSLPRQVIYYLASMEGVSTHQIGKAIGGRDHSTILHGIRKIEAQLETDNILRDDIDVLKIAIAENAALARTSSCWHEANPQNRSVAS